MSIILDIDTVFSTDELALAQAGQNETKEVNDQISNKGD